MDKQTLHVLREQSNKRFQEWLEKRGMTAELERAIAMEQAQKQEFEDANIPEALLQVMYVLESHAMIWMDRLMFLIDAAPQESPDVIQMLKNFSSTFLSNDSLGLDDLLDL